MELGYDKMGSTRQLQYSGGWNEDMEDIVLRHILLRTNEDWGNAIKEPVEHKEGWNEDTGSTSQESCKDGYTED
jgi:hypothetical protein